MRTVRSSVLAVVATILAAGHAFADITPPIVTAQVTGTPGNSGWYVSDVTVTWTVEDPESAILSSSGCGPVTITSDALTYATCSASSVGGSTSVTQTIGRDTTGPVIEDTGNLGIYDVDDTITIFCNASDPLAGVASTDCAPITGPASSYPIETPIAHSFSAVDHAGNSTTVPVTFTVNVTYDGLAGLVDRVTRKESLDRNLQKLLFMARDAELAGDLALKQRHLQHFADRLRQNSARNLDAADAQMLLMMVAYL